MPKPTDYDKTHLRNMAAIGTRIDRIFKKAAEEAAKIGVSIKAALPEDRLFSFNDYPETKKQIDRLMTALQESMETTIVNGVRSEWTLSNNKNNALASRVFGDNLGKLTKEQYRRYYSTNGNALDAFIKRKENGLTLSDRVWKYTDAFKNEIEFGLDLGIRSGENAASLARSLQEYLQYPDKLFRRVRDKHGILRLSKAAKAFHPGRGVYRSSHKNARRLAATETNIAYRTSDHLRWQQMDFVVGIEIKLSNNHTVNGMPLTDICDTLKGRYPKDFKFVGWHPHCRCHVVTILKTEEEMMRDTQRILNGEQPLKGSVNTVKSVPSAFKDWVEEHSERIEKGGKLPYFIADNRKRVNKMLGIVSGHEEGSLIRLGDQEWTVDELIGECRIEPTENGKIYVHPDHGESELAENLEFARWRAEQFGEEVILLPNPQNIKSPNSYNITRGVQEEYKRSSTPTKNSIDRLIRDGSKQANHIVLAVDSDITPRTLQSGIKGRVVQNSEIKELRIRIGNAEAVYSRESIIAKDFKIKPEDFHDVSIFRSEADRPIERPADAKLAKFFGLNKKSPKEIALERHAKRDVAKIQQAWNERRISNLAKAVKDGYLPKESISGLSELKQDAFNTRVSALQKAANRHKMRNSQAIADAQFKWSQRRVYRLEWKKIIPSDLKKYNELLEMISPSNVATFDINKFNATFSVVSRHMSRTKKQIKDIRDRWDARYIEQAGEKTKLEALRKEIEKQKITSIDDIDRIMQEFYAQFPEEFNNVKIDFVSFDEVPQSDGFTLGYSVHDTKIAFNSNKGWNKVSPLKHLTNAFEKVRNGKKLKLEELQSIATVVHELLHQKAAKYKRLKSHYSGDYKRTAMETMNELASRATTVRFMRRIGANTEGVTELIERGKGYGTWVSRVLEVCKKADINPEVLGQQWATTLATESYDTMDDHLYDFFKTNADEKGFTLTKDEALAIFEDTSKEGERKWRAMLKKWFH